MLAAAEPVEIWLVRHGETASSRARRLAGWADIPLTEEGERQARAVRPLLDGQVFDSAWSSDLQRTISTALLAFGAARPDRRLREIDFGSLEGVPYAEMPEPLRQALDRFEGFVAPNGESLDDVRRRAFEWADELPIGRHLAFTHGGVIRTFGRSVGADQFVPTGSVLVLEWTTKRHIATHLRPTS